MVSEVPRGARWIVSPLEHAVHRPSRRTPSPPRGGDDDVERHYLAGTVMIEVPLYVQVIVARKPVVDVLRNLQY
jgi:hypothetical protein